MKKIRVNLKERSYDILIGNRIISKFPALIRKATKQKHAIIITNPVIASRFAKKLKQVLKRGGFSLDMLFISDSEKAKSFLSLNRLLQRVALCAKDKQPFIIALGGGVVGDVAGFVSSIYKRGIPYIQIPTTLLAQIDSSIGGKTAVDLPSGKNLVGAFYQPKSVLVDISFLSSLPQRQVRCGLSEMIKYAIIKDARLFVFLEKNYSQILKLTPAQLLPAILSCVQVKAKIVSEDEEEKKGVRTILNFGHTIGHAIETQSSYRYNHGEAIGLGMIAAANISFRLKLISTAVYERIFSLIKECGLPTECKRINLKRVMRTMRFDKKFIGRINRFVLPLKIGKVIVKKNIKESIIKQALDELILPR